MDRIKGFKCYYYNVEANLMILEYFIFNNKDFNYVVKEYRRFNDIIIPEDIIVYSMPSLNNTILTFETFNFPF